MGRSVAAKAFLFVLMSSLFTTSIIIGITKASEPGYERIEYPTQVKPTIDGIWTTPHEWTDSGITMIGEDVAFRSTWELVDNNVPTQWVVEFLSDTTDDPGDYWQFCIDGDQSGGSAPQVGDYKFEIKGHTNLIWYEGDGTGWNEVKLDASEIEWDNSLSASPTNSKPHWILEFNIVKNTGTVQIGVTWNFRLAVYDESSPARPLAWPPTDGDLPDSWGVNGYTSDPFTPSSQPPSASFTSSPSSPKVGETVSFDASASSDPDGTIVDYAWNFGDGSTGTGNTTTHSYSNAEQVTVTLEVTDNDGLTDTATKTITVRPLDSEIEDDEPPVADAGNDRNVNAGSKVTFSAAGSTDNVGIDSYAWDFGDGNSGIGETVSYTYGDVGNYTVTLTVVDAAGNFDTDTILVTVKEEAPDGFPFWILIPIIAAIVVVVLLWFFFFRKKKPEKKEPKPVKVRVTAEPSELLADGKTKSAITVELLDVDGNPVPAPDNTEIRLTTTKGMIEQPVVRISKGKEKEQTLLVSPKEGGKATLSANVEELGSTSVTVTFLEKTRYCMHCGSKMPFAEKKCPICNKFPPSGVDTKSCKNCGTVVPAVAKFCADCGARQEK